jgi:hypothetical protein
MVSMDNLVGRSYDTACEELTRLGSIHCLALLITSAPTLPGSAAPRSAFATTYDRPFSVDRDATTTNPKFCKRKYLCHESLAKFSARSRMSQASAVQIPKHDEIRFGLRTTKQVRSLSRLRGFASAYQNPENNAKWNRIVDMTLCGSCETV